jgi:hypothetical protein
MLQSFNPWSMNPMFGSRSQNPDFAWLASEISAIRSGVENLVKESATSKEKIQSVEARVTANEAKFEARALVVDSAIQQLNLINAKKDSAWTGPVRVGAFLAMVVPTLAFLIQYGFLHIIK